MGSAVTIVAEERNSILHIARTTVAALASQLIAQTLHMPEPYWATVTTMVVMQSSLGAAWKVSWKRLAGTVLGGVVGGFLSSHFAGNLLAFGLAMVATGLVCLITKVDRSAYRFAGITLTIIMLVPPIHCCVEVSLGIAVALVLAALWPERIPETSEMNGLTE